MPQLNSVHPADGAQHSPQSTQLLGYAHSALSMFVGVTWTMCGSGWLDAFFILPKVEDVEDAEANFIRAQMWPMMLEMFLRTQQVC